MSEADKPAEYQRYAEACLATVQFAPSREQRVLLREMAAEWFKLASAVERKPMDQANQRSADQANQRSADQNNQRSAGRDAREDN